MAAQLGPTLQALRPGARALGPSLAQTRPFLGKSTPIIRDELRPFARAALPAVTDLRPALRDLSSATPNLTRSFRVVNRLFNELAYNPPGKTDEGYLFWLSWANHLAPTVFATQDAHGPIRHGVIIFGCQTVRTLNVIGAANPLLGTLVNLLNAPSEQQMCPQTSQAPGAGGG
jgi:phospholipid/cholesterol/gamma-HCH transport system substrate-binding protein